MRLSILSSDLLRATNMALKVIESRNILPILDNVLIHQDPSRGEMLNMMASSIDRTIDMQLPLAIVEGEFFPFCLNANCLCGLVKQLPECAIEMSVERSSRFQEMTISWRGGSFHMQAEKADDYPLPNIHDQVVCQFSMPADQLLPSISIASSFASKEDLKPALNGVGISASNDGVRIYATDTKRLSRHIHEPGAPFLSAGQPCSVIIPLQGMPAINAIHSSQSPLQFTMLGSVDPMSVNRIRLSVDGIELIIRTSDVKLPRFEAVIPSNLPYHVTFNVEELRRTLRILGIAIENNKDKQVVMELSDGGMFGSTTKWFSHDIEWSRKSEQELAPTVSRKHGGDTPDCNLPSGYRIGMHCNFVLDILSHISTPTVVFNFCDPQRPVIITDDEANSLDTYLVMPMKIYE